MAVIPRDMRDAPLDELRRVAREELAEIFARIVSEAGSETLYLIGLTVSGRHLSPTAVANTAEALQERRGRIYTEQGVGDYDLDPWDPGQWRWVEACPRFDRLTSDLEKQHDAWRVEQPGGARESWTEIQQNMDSLLLDVLIECDQADSFGPSRRAGDAALLYMDEGDFTDDDWRSMFTRLNPAPVRDRLLEQWHLA